MGKGRKNVGGNQMSAKSEHGSDNYVFFVTTEQVAMATDVNVKYTKP